MGFFKVNCPVPFTTTSTTTTTTTAPVSTSTTTTTTTAPPAMVIEIQNSIGTVLNNFTVALNGINVPSLTNISLPTAPNTNGNAVNAIDGTNSIIITDNVSSAVMTVLISDITDRVTGIPLTFTRTGNGTNTVTINPITFSAGNIVNGIKIILS